MEPKTIYRCSYCEFELYDEKTMLGHEEICDSNPANRTCITCQFDEPSRSLVPETLEYQLLMSLASHPDCPLLKSIPGIDANLKIDGHVKGCPHWKEFKLAW